MRTQILASVLLTMIAAVALATSAAAQPQIIQTSCDTLSLDPVEVRVGFSIVNTDPRVVCKIRFIPWDPENDPPEVCPVSECAGPENWLCVGPPSRGIWEAREEPPPVGHAACVQQGETQDGFSVVMQGAYCWYHVAYFEALALEPFSWEIVNFDCGEPVQAQTSTWGELKAVYR